MAERIGCQLVGALYQCINRYTSIRCFFLELPNTSRTLHTFSILSFYTKIITMLIFYNTIILVTNTARLLDIFVCFILDAVTLNYFKLSTSPIM